MRAVFTRCSLCSRNLVSSLFTSSTTCSFQGEEADVAVHDTFSLFPRKISRSAPTPAPNGSSGVDTGQLVRPFLEKRLPSVLPPLRVRGVHHVLDGYAPFGARSRHLVEVHAQLLGLLLGGICSHRLLRVRRAFVRLLSSLSRGVLHPLRRLSGLLGHLSQGALRLVGYLPRSVLRSSTGNSTGELLRALFDLLGNLSDIGRNLQVEDAPVLAELQLDEGAGGLLPHGTYRLPLFVGVLFL